MPRVSIRFAAIRVISNAKRNGGFVREHIQSIFRVFERNGFSTKAADRMQLDASASPFVPTQCEVEREAEDALTWQWLENFRALSSRAHVQEAQSNVLASDASDAMSELSVGHKRDLWSGDRIQFKAVPNETGPAERQWDAVPGNTL